MVLSTSIARATAAAAEWRFVVELVLVECRLVADQFGDKLRQRTRTEELSGRLVVVSEGLSAVWDDLTGVVVLELPAGRG